MTTTHHKRLRKILAHFTTNKDSVLTSNMTAAPKCIYHTDPCSFPKPDRNMWRKSASTSEIKPYSQDIQQYFNSENKNFDTISQYIKLWLSSNKNNRFKHSIKENDNKWKDLSIMKGSGYGINFGDFYDLISYWNNNFNANKYILKLSSFNHLQTIIQGLKIHFIKESGSKASISSMKCKADAIILLHGLYMFMSCVYIIVL